MVTKSKPLQEAESRIDVLRIAGERYRDAHQDSCRRVILLEEHIRELRAHIGTCWQANDFLRNLLIGMTQMSDGRFFRDHLRDGMMIKSNGLVSDIDNCEKADSASKKID